MSFNGRIEIESEMDWFLQSIRLTQLKVTSRTTTQEVL